MFKVLYIVPTLLKGGPAMQLFNLVKYLDRRQFLPQILTLSAEPKDSMEEDFKRLGVPVSSLGLGRFSSFIHARYRIRDYVAKHKPDIVHSYGFRTDLFCAWINRTVHTVATVHGCLFENYAHNFGWIGRHLMAPLHLKMLRRIKRPVAVSNSVSKMVSEHINLAIDVIHNGVDSDVFYPPVDNKFKQELRRKLGIPLTKKVFISAGHLTALKDPLTILNAFQDKDIPNDCYLVVIGDGPLLSYCQKYGKSDNMVFLGRVPSVAEYFQACDFFISSSQTEGLPYATMEAMACGLPCVLSDIEAHREIVEYNRKSAKLFETKNVSMAVSKINEILKDDYSEMSRAAISIIRDNLNAKTMSEKYQSLYLKICAH